MTIKLKKRKVVRKKIMTVPKAMPLSTRGDEYDRICDSLPRCEISIEEVQCFLHNNKTVYGPYQCGGPSLTPCKKCGINVCYYHSTWEGICGNCIDESIDKGELVL